jgi:hypothetical protein
VKVAIDFAAATVIKVAESYTRGRPFLADSGRT